MSRYHHRKDGTPVQAIQFTNQESVKRIQKEFHCHVDQYKNDGYVTIDHSTGVWRGQYAVLAICGIVAMDQKTFDERFEKDETQLEIFDGLR